MKCKIGQNESGMTWLPIVAWLLGAVMLGGALVGCSSSVLIPELHAGQRLTVQIDQASALVENDMRPDSRKAREESLRGS